MKQSFFFQFSLDPLSLLNSKKKEMYFSMLYFNLIIQAYVTRMLPFYRRHESCQYAVVITVIWLKLYILPLVLKWIYECQVQDFSAVNTLGGWELSLLFWFRHQELIFHRSEWSKTRPRVMSDLYFSFFPLLL